VYFESLIELSQDSLVDANVAEPRPTLGPNIKSDWRLTPVCSLFELRRSPQFATCYGVRGRDDRKGVEKREGTDT
jgi:hypothetical protein